MCTTSILHLLNYSLLMQRILLGCLLSTIKCFGVNNKFSSTTVASSVHRIFETGGPGNSENLRITKTRMKIFPPRISPFFLSKKDQRKRSSPKISPVFGPKLGEDQKKKKKGLHPNSVRFLVFVYRLCAQTFCPSYKMGGGPCRNFAYYSMLIATQRGAMVQWPPPLNTPLTVPVCIANIL